MKILCVGQNYKKHVAELGSMPNDEPVWFWKPESAIVRDGEQVRIPTDVGEVHHEVELAVRIGSDGRPDAFTVAVDITARDLQKADKAAGRPWQKAKGYDTFLPLGEWVPADGVDLQDLRLRLGLDGNVRQDGKTSAMTWTVAELIDHASSWVSLRPGDILLTGTPEGVGPIQVGQDMVAQIVGHARIQNTIKARSRQ